MRGKPRNVPTVEYDAPMRRPHNPCCGVEECCLAGAIWTDDRPALAARYRNADAVDGLERPEGHHQFINDEYGIGHGRMSRKMARVQPPRR